MDVDIQQAIRIIDAKIASLQEARDRLAMAFGINEPTIQIPLRPLTNRSGEIPATQSNGHVKPSGRKLQLAEFIQQHGPMARGEIIEKAGMPEGTVAYCLNDKDFFQQAENGTWDITEYARNAITRKVHTGAMEH